MRTFKNWLMSFKYKYVYHDIRDKNKLYIQSGNNKAEKLKIKNDVGRMFGHLKYVFKTNLKNWRTYKISVWEFTK